MKKAARDIVAKILWSQTNRLINKNKIITVAIAGSVGKTSTKMAAAAVISERYKTLIQEGNYNDYISVPLIYFGQKLPNIYNPLAWIWVFIKNEIKILKPYNYELVIAELGTDTPGDMEEFSKYIKADIGLLTAIAPEHMEYFKTLDAVADEEMAIAKYSHKLLVNKDLCASKYLDKLDTKYLSYALKSSADYKLSNLRFNGYGADFELQHNDKTFVSASHEAIVEPQLYAVLAAAAVAKELGVGDEKIRAGINKVHAFYGRMNVLSGINNSKIIDDTYNASPEAAAAALTTLYRLNAPHKIAVLGNMNELGDSSQEAHTKIGSLCDPKKLEMVVTIGPDANEYLAAAAKAKGCQVQTFDSPYAAGEFLAPIIKDDSLILVKGSQNKVFAEEVVKRLLADKSDVAKLVRQSPQWLAKKRKVFGVYE